MQELESLKPGYTLDETILIDSLPDGFTFNQETKYLDASVPEFDMTSEFTTEFLKVEAGMKIARQSLDIAETAIVSS